ncbi:amino acid ABC transporter ATP-binding protein [Clostridium cochlearium]|uniref:amino acid ABC transporter ATP-binding protein n=1 Tax=Clostridium cochlearium TaxID=1494 RepID=UPI001828557A|nr:amino acid ABC transporter ATP-binding protein [Clostridium cochlearium]NMA58510.1 amino acid ABC transporter ATP-binding protein [Clostridium cochlearium]
MNVIETVDITKRFNTLTVFEKLNINVKKGEVLVIIGPSGSGKSTFLRCLNNLEKIDEGKILIDGEELNPKDKAKMRNMIIKMGMVFQNFNLFPHMTALENVMEAPITVKGEDKEKVRKRAEDLLKKVGLADRADAYPSKLSGGQKQRVAIARALANNPPIILADEPTGNLDTKSAEEIMNIFLELNREGSSIILVTHEPEIAKYADRIIMFKDGCIIEDRRKEGVENNLA